MTPIIRALDPTYASLGIAVHFLARREPFASFRLGDVIHTVDVQIRRRHALFAFEGERVAGFLGWALYSHEDARRFAETGRPPPPDTPDGADVAWLLMAAATSTEALKGLLREGRALNVGRRVMGVRHKPGGKRVIFDQPISAKPISAKPISAKPISAKPPRA
ncbi:MAG: hypothetical protein K2X71_02520 [Methylobacterium sp.]|uniref:hypothetical protein n=1 Tax=Methylobacterium sp. TaxID=409 RepID=UPI002589944D|nr:hypothetical protein [Methylobacterium sp.]MBY0294901.1 hypothetical protein [Methylobacterium sp.]